MTKSKMADKQVNASSVMLLEALLDGLLLSITPTYDKI